MGGLGRTVTRQHNADTPERRRETPCVDGSALFRTPGQLDQILQSQVQSTEMVAPLTSAAPAPKSGPSSGPTLTPVPDDPHSLPFSARQRLFERDSARRDSCDFTSSLRTTLFKDNETVAQEHPATALQTPTQAMTVTEAAPSAVSMGDTVSMEIANLQKSELDDAVVAATTQDTTVQQERVEQRSPPQSPETSFADVGVGTNRRRRHELVRRDATLQEHEEWWRQRLDSIGNRERAAARREQQIGNRELAIARHTQAHCVREQQLVERERAVARDEQVVGEKVLGVARLEQALLERERETYRREKAVAFHIGAIHGNRGTATQDHSCTPEASDEVQASIAITCRFSTARCVARRAVRVARRCWSLIGSVLILHALLLALPLEYQLMRLQFDTEIQTTPTCFQPALAAGEEERAAVELSKLSVLADPSLDDAAVSFNEATRVVAAEAEPSANASASLQVAAHNTYVNVKSVASVGCGLFFYVATFVLG